MPRDDTAPVVKNPNPTFFGETPRTVFRDWLDAINVTLVNYPNGGTVYHAMAQMQLATWGHDEADLLARVQEAELSASLEGKTLPLNLEIPAFTFRISGISRVITHQIVRTRVGVVYSQRGTGDQDCRHDDALVPRSLNRPGMKSDLWDYIQAVLEAKRVYSSSVDNGHSLVAMRYVLPHCLSQYIFVNINLMALMGLVGKRLCTYETVEYNVVAKKMVEAVAKIFPDFAKYLVADCDKPGGCHYQRSFGKMYAGSVYAPDQKHDKGPWNPESYVYYDQTRDMMLDGPVFEDREYLGFERVR